MILKDNDLFENNKVIQRIISLNGDCMKCCFCTLFNEKYEDIPDFNGNDWYKIFEGALAKKGWKFGKTLFNYIYNKDIADPISGCFNNVKLDLNSMISENTLKSAGGVVRTGDLTGAHKIMFASVFSIHLYKSGIDFNSQQKHMVLCDENADIVFDPNPAYAEILHYPLADVIGYSGIDEIWPLNRF